MSTQPPADIDALMDKGLDSFEADTAAPPAEAAPPAAEAPKEAKTDEAVPEPTSEVSSQPSEAPKYGKDYQDLLNKFDGDHDKAAKAYWETNNRAAQLAKELEELKSKSAPPAPETQPAKEVEPEVHPDLKRFDESLRAIEAEHATVRETHAKLVKKKDDNRTRIEELIDVLANGEVDFEQEQALRKELRQKRTAAQQIEASIKEVQREDANLRREYSNQTTLKNQEERLLKLQQAREAEITERNRLQEDAALETFTLTFFKSITEVAKEGTPIPAELMDDWKAFAKKESHLRLNVEDLPTTDVPAFTQKLKADFEAQVDRAHRVKSAIYAAKKLKDADVSAPEGDRAVASTTKKTGFRSQSEVDRFMDEAASGL